MDWRLVLKSGSEAGHRHLPVLPLTPPLVDWGMVRSPDSRVQPVVSDWDLGRSLVSVSRNTQRDQRLAEVPVWPGPSVLLFRRLPKVKGHCELHTICSDICLHRTRSPSKVPDVTSDLLTMALTSRGNPWFCEVKVPEVFVGSGPCWYWRPTAMVSGGEPGPELLLLLLLLLLLVFLFWIFMSYIIFIFCTFWVFL